MRALRGLLALVAVASVATCGCRYFKRSLPADFRRGGLELVYGVASPLDAAAAEQMAFVLTGRIEALELCHPDVKVTGRELTVRLPAECGPASQRIKDLIIVGGRLELREVDDGEGLASIAGRVPPGAGIVLGAERWTDRTTGATRQARVLEGTAEALERFRASLALGTLPADVEALVEPAAAGRRASRLYLVKREAALTRSNLYDARVLADARSGRPVVSAEFDVRGAALLRALTERVAGRKVAIVLDGRILATPVAAGVIVTGAVQIDVDPVLDPTKAREAAHDLAAALRTGILPAPLTLLRESAIPGTR